MDELQTEYSKNLIYIASAMYFYYTQIMDQMNSQNFWDPLKDDISTQTYLAEQRVFLDKLTTYQKRPYILKIYFIFLCLPPFAAIIFLFTTKSLFVQLIIVSFFPIVAFYRYIMHIQSELVLYLLCNKNNWIFNPYKNAERLNSFKVLLPNIFNNGDDENLQDEIWGKINEKNRTINFWRSEYNYTTGSGRSRKTQHKFLYVIQLPKPIPTPFMLVHANFFSRFDSKIKTESDEFNNIFRIISGDNIDETKREIIKTLSPSVQTRLIDFGKRYKPEIILFQYNMLILQYTHDILGTQYTNFFRKVEIDTHDEVNFNSVLFNMAELPSEMIQFI